jgi:hypothetical protein
MRAIRLDFAGRSNRLQRGVVVLLLLAIAAAAYLGKSYVALSSDLTEWENKWRGLQKVQNSRTESGPGKKAEWEQLQTELKAANRVIGHLSMPWDALFHEVENSITSQVSLLSVEPDTEKREVHIVAEAKSLNGMLDYVRRLRTSTLFKDAYVVSHQTQEQDPQRPVQFVVNVQWVGLPVNISTSQDKMPVVQN